MGGNGGTGGVVGGAFGFARLFLSLWDLTERSFSDYNGFLPDAGEKDEYVDTVEPQTAGCQWKMENGKLKVDTKGGSGDGGQGGNGVFEWKIENGKWKVDEDGDNGGTGDRGGIGGIGGKVCTGGYVMPIGSGPSPMYKNAVGKNLLMNIINGATKYIYITTPYLIVDYDLTGALRLAAGRGVDVRIITPAIADKKIIKIMTKGSYQYLLEAGVRIFEYTPGFIHEKLAVSDDIVAMIGSINLDYRSLVHHFEDAAVVFASPVIAAVRDGFLDTESKSTGITPDAARLTFAERAVRNLVRILSPLL